VPEARYVIAQHEVLGEDIKTTPSPGETTFFRFTPTLGMSSLRDSGQKTRAAQHFVLGYHMSCLRHCNSA